MLGPCLPRESVSSIRPYVGNAESKIITYNGKDPKAQNYGNQWRGRGERRHEDGKGMQKSSVEGVRVSPSLKG